MAGSGTYNPARPKRAGDQYTRTHHLGEDEPSTKKPRFDPRNPSQLAPDAEERDPVLDADEVGKGRGIKRNAVNIDGYDSDSSTENFDLRAAAAAKAKETEAAKDDDDDDDDDMFAEETTDKPDKPAEGSKKSKKDVRFLKDHEIEGQEQESKAGGKVRIDWDDEEKSSSGESSSESGDDEARDAMDSDMDEELGAGSKKKHAPRLDAFNMKAEQEEGRFDEAGNYVRKAFDPDAAQDAWLDGISKKDMKKARLAKEAQEAERRERQRQDDAIDTSAVLSQLLEYLDRGESAIEALARLNKIVLKRPPKPGKKNPQDMDVEVDPAEEKAAAKAQAAIDAICDCASKLDRRDVDDAWGTEREMLLRLYKRETGEDWKDPNPNKWEMRWLADVEQKAHGLYPAATMIAWTEAGHFEAGAEFRRVGHLKWSSDPVFY
ncbi:hypothetical protein P154DRAFT_571227 [Amniculicola lignicola CBS 123094]|uniref:GYF domain-containing protein n=1 Tax=Amniculicola lignicola CBS 123094 TaxID=1392246 RepID=A0A6A5WUX0_9PLEO|nr:hypothetical protein P154DRAFT_571227 [Amniculicola lignicola CBS 123094]